MSDLGVRIRENRRRLDAEAGELRVVKQRSEELQQELSDLSEMVVNYERAVTLLNHIGEEKQFAAQEAIEQLVTRGLQTIFDETLSFHIIQDVKARRAEVNFVIHTALPNGRVVSTDVMDARGGGVAATVGFLLRLVVMLLGDADKTNLIVLDETFAHVSEEYVPAVGEFLRKIVDKTNVRILMVTHQPEFAEFADRVYRVSTGADGFSVVKEQK